MITKPNSSFVRLQDRIGGFPIEIPAAASMAIAVTALTVALPDWRFESMIAATGLPGLVSAAQPPLGQTARILVALLLAGLSFVGVWAGLRALDRPAAPSDFPAFRAADLHPDAPRRRPILADAEFGPPAAAEPEPAPGRRRPLVSEPLPSFLAPQPPSIGDFVPEPLEAVEAQDAFFEEAANDDSRAEPVRPLLRSKPIISVSEPDEPAPAAIESDTFEVPAAAMPSFLQPRAPAPAAPAHEAVEADISDGDSVSQLMARLETGLTRRGAKPRPGTLGSQSLDAAQEELADTLIDLNRSTRRAR